MLRRIAFFLPLFTVAVVTAQSQSPVDTTLLRVSRVILYKSGVGYFEHLGTITGSPSIAVQFTGDQLDDVLKSLTVVDLGDGRVTGISYDSPTPTERRLQALRLPLSARATRLQLLEALRGARVEARSAAAVVAGRVLHVERRTRQSGSGVSSERDELTLVTDDGELVTIELDEGVRIRLVDAGLRQDVGRYLEIATSDGARSPRRLVLATTGSGQRQLLVSYVGEAPVWKTSYRLVFPTAASGRPVLQGWAIVDNVSGSDWENVELSLVAGAPQAFRQPLSAPLFATRPLVPLAAGSGLAPQTHAAPLERGMSGIRGVARDNGGGVLPGVSLTAFDEAQRPVGSAYSDAQGRFSLTGLPASTITLRAELVGFQTIVFSGLALIPGSTLERDITMRVGALQETVTVAAEAPPARSSAGGSAGGRFRAAPPPPPAAAPSLEAIEQRVLDQPIAATGADLGDLFEYRLKDRVTIRRNQSALVPILQTAVEAERISLWNGGMGTRPRRAVWLTNNSDLTLDAGSVTVVDAGAFAGEGLVDPIKPRERRLISFASDLAVQVAARQDTSPGRLTRVRIAEGMVTQDSEQRERRTYTIRNDDRDQRIVIVEHPARSGWKLAGTVKPDESTAAVHRFRVVVAARQTATLDVDELQLGTTSIAVRDFHQERLLMVAQTGGSREALERAMAPVFAKSAEIDRLHSDMARLQQEMNAISDDQNRVRQNMAVLKGSATERQLLERYTRQLDAQETRLDAISRELSQLRDQLSRSEQQLETLIMTLKIDITAAG